MSEKRRVFLGADHAGVLLKDLLLESLRKEFPEREFVDLGTHGTASVDYPEFGRKVAEAVVGEPRAQGILVCGSGIGISIAANKVKSARAALAWDVTSARLSRQHNDANIVSFGARLIGAEVALDAARAFLSTPFEGGRHQRRVDLISLIESEG
jgi:ribose 5-phosphate isomerase B